MPLTESQKSDYLNQMRAFMHAHLDDRVALIECKRKSDGVDVLVACLVVEVTVPPRVMGGTPTLAQQIVPIFEFVDPHGENPYVSQDKDLVEAERSPLILPGGATEQIRNALEASNEAPAHGGNAEG